MTIIKRSMNRNITELEFLRLKGQAPFSDYRQDAKAVNFGFLFGMSYRKFVSQSLETSWKIEKVDTFIEEKGLQDELEAMIKRNERDSLKMNKYFTVANYIRTNFFKAYKGLEERIKRNIQFAKDHGYIRSHHGAFRKLPLFPLAFDGDYKRKDEKGVEISNWSNITANTSIQTDEVCTILQSMTEFREKVSKELLDAWIYGMVHDSGDNYVKVEQIIPTTTLMRQVFERNDPWQKGITFPIDISVVDMTDRTQYYKAGLSLKAFLKNQKAN